MIGNDLIDLNLAFKESNWKRKGYLERLFSNTERNFLMEQSDQNFYVWLYWSMKEASYKIIHRSQLIRSFNPGKFECSLTFQNKNRFEGKVLFEDKSFYLKSEICRQFIHSIAFENANYFKKITTYLDQTYLNQTSFFMNCLSEDEYFFKDKNGIPFIGNQKNKLKKIASLSHHGSAIALIIGQEDTMN